jgi:hypothetical protein
VGGDVLKKLKGEDRSGEGDRRTFEQGSSLPEVQPIFGQGGQQRRQNNTAFCSLFLVTNTMQVT